MPTAGAAAHEATVGDKELKGGNVKKALQHYKKALGALSAAAHLLV
eukprot:SAG22_NODE_3221_length_1847_cov_1.870709_2_plen_46_part_00